MHKIYLEELTHLVLFIRCLRRSDKEMCLAISAVKINCVAFQQQTISKYNNRRYFSIKIVCKHLIIVDYDAMDLIPI
jgi:hypothetical protein